MAGQLKVGGNIIASHSGVEGAGEVTLQNVTLGDSAVPSRSMNFRNKIINGDMRIDQRNAGVISNPTGGTYTYTIDRWQLGFYNPGSRVTNVQQVSDDVPKGFSHSMKVSCGNNSGTQHVNEQLRIEQLIEGQDLNGIEWYNSTPSTLTLSFYVKSNLTGTFPLTIKLSDNNSSSGSSSSRILPLKYEINSANTWERKTVTFTLDSYAGTRIISNTFAMSILFWLAAGSDRRGNTYNAWRTNSNAATLGLDNYTFLDSTSNEFFITGVQLEEGTVATPFEHRPIGVEQSLCERYYEIVHDAYGEGHRPLSAAWTTANSNCFIPFRTRKRSTSSNVSITGTMQIYNGTWGDATGVVLLGSAGHTGVTLDVRRTGGYTARYVYFIRNGKVTVDAEL